MPPKTTTKAPKTPKTPAGAKSDAPPVNVDSITSGIQGVTLTKGVKTPAFTPYSTKVLDPILVRTVFVDGEQYIEFDMSVPAASLCGDGINAVLASDGMIVSLHRGVYASFFTNRRYRKDLDAKYAKDSSNVIAHCKVCDEFKKKESLRCGVVYGECQLVQLPCECTGLVQEAYRGIVPTPITIPFAVTSEESGMNITEKVEHIQFMLDITFRVKTVGQFEKEKRKVVEVIHKGYDILADYDSEGSV